MKKIFIDCGYHLGQGLDYFINHLNIDDTWHVIIFEPNKYCNAEKRIKDKGYNFTYEIKNAAVYSENGKMTFLCKCHGDQTHNGLADQSNNMHDMASSLLIGGEIGLNGVNPLKEDDIIEVETISLSEVIEDMRGSEIYVKLDVEGAEFPILKKMIQDNTISYVSKMWVEWHICDLFDTNEMESIKSECIKHCEMMDWH
jgi:FkbM family methyltransferase